LNKDDLPQHIISSLSNAFSKNKSSDKPEKTRDRTLAARKRLQLFKKQDILPTAGSLKFVTLVENDPWSFWKSAAILQQDRNYTNALQCLYYGARHCGQQAVTLRAFFTTAIYLYTKTIREKLDLKTLTGEALSHCIRLVLGPETGEQDKKIVGENLRQDSKVGAIYQQYAKELGGYGAYFLMGVLPVSTCVFLNYNSYLY
jgi:hypothetical protein